MLISRVPDEAGSEGRGGERGEAAQHFHTADDLFELMARDHDFEATEEDPLTTRDLVLLYKNIELGEQLMSNVHESKRRTPNRRVESVTYRGARGSDSDLSDCFSGEDLDSLVQINKERIDLLTNTLCHKFGNTEIQASGFDVEYDRHFLFKDPYIKEQLMNLKLMSTSNELDSATLPASLLDYICCKRLEDNYNFYTDNIIRYVKNTIEQLKRISNGDYLTDKAKQKWREVENEKDGGDKVSKVLTTSTSIPLRVERKLTGRSTTWGEPVRSEVDLRSLAKILEKRIVVEVPKLICGSYKLFSNRREDNLLVSCKRRQLPAGQCAARRSGTGQLLGNVHSVMLLQSKLLPLCQKDELEALPLTYKEPIIEAEAETVKIIELHELEHVVECNTPRHSTSMCPKSDSNDNRGSLTDLQENVFEEKDGSCVMEYCNSGNGRGSGACDDSERVYVVSPRGEGARSEGSRVEGAWGEGARGEGAWGEGARGEGAWGEGTRGEGAWGEGTRGVVSHIVRAEASLNHATPDDINFTIQTLNRHTSLPEETTDNSIYTKTKKKSPTRVRIKSPYENKSHILEERKRKKLLEVRERREHKKMAMKERAKISKHKFCKSTIVPQASSSVTKLSITNKSFYNSIFGHNIGNIENVVFNNTKKRKGQKKDDMIPEIVLEQPEEEPEEPEATTRKYDTRSYYLDDPVTEMMYLQMKHNKDGGRTSASTSVVSDSGANFSLSQSYVNLVAREVLPAAPDHLRPELNHHKSLTNSQSELSIFPTPTPEGSSTRVDPPADKVAGTVECRRSIDKIYMLMKKLGKIESKDPAGVALRGAPSSARAAQSDSGTSLKHQLTSSNPSSFSFQKPICGKGLPPSPTCIKGTPLEPKVIISSKQREKPDADKPAKGQKRVTLSPCVKRFPDNPLKAISMLLHEFDSVQKTRQKSVADLKKKDAVPVDGRSLRQDACKRRPRVDQPAYLRDRPAERGKIVSPRGKQRVESVADGRRLAELIEEAREARGEAVRGPGLSARLDALAQPRRPHGPHTRARTQMSERIHRPAATKPPNVRVRPRPDPAAPPGSDKATPLPLERAAADAGARRPAGGARAHAQPQALKKKMVAVESYVKVHYGRGAAAGHRTRAPLLPCDLELSSMSMSSPTPDESGAIGSKLHTMINSICEQRDALEHLARTDNAGQTDRVERPKSASQLLSDLFVAPPRRPSPKSNTVDDISSDQHTTTAVETVLSHDQLKPAKKQSDLQIFSSITELEMLQSALRRKMSLGAFPKRLRIQNLTLAPEGSAQRLMWLQAGDTTSLLLNANLSHNYKINTSKSMSNELDFKMTKHLDWRFSQLPMQISTVGYAFPNYERRLQSKTVQLKNVCNDTDEVTEKGSSEFYCDAELNDTNDSNNEDKLCQCLKGNPQKRLGSECAVQANDTDFASIAARTADLTSNVQDIYASTVSKSNAETNTTDDRKEDKTMIRQSTVSTDIAKKTTEQSEMEILSTIEGERSQIDYTTSLDMLVGLLNEIQKITTSVGDGEGSDACDPAELCGVLDTAGLVTAAQNSSISKLPHTVTSQELKTSCSLFSLHVSNETAVRDTSAETSTDTKSLSGETVPGSREAAAQAPDERLSLAPELRDPCSLMDPVLRAPTRTHSMIAFAKGQSPFSEPPSDRTSDIMRLREIGTHPGSVKSLVIFHDNVVRDVKKEVAVVCKGLVKNAAARRGKSASGDALLNTVELFGNRSQRKRNLNKCCLNAADFDPKIKMKRDILVTVYSFLVLTVVAALSFPEIMLHQT